MVDRLVGMLAARREAAAWLSVRTALGDGLAGASKPESTDSRGVSTPWTFARAD